MSDRKSADNKTVPCRQTFVPHNRRMEEVKRNFAVGMQRIVADRIMNRGLTVKARQENTA